MPQPFSLPDLGPAGGPSTAGNVGRRARLAGAAVGMAAICAVLSGAAEAKARPAPGTDGYGKVVSACVVARTEVSGVDVDVDVSVEVSVNVWAALHPRPHPHPDPSPEPPEPPEPPKPPKPPKHCPPRPHPTPTPCPPTPTPAPKPTPTPDPPRPSPPAPTPVGKPLAPPPAPAPTPTATHKAAAVPVAPPSTPPPPPPTPRPAPKRVRLPQAAPTVQLKPHRPTPPLTTMMVVTVPAVLAAAAFKPRSRTAQSSSRS